MDWVEAFLLSERAWLEEATARGVSPELVRFGERFLARLEEAKRTAEAEQFTVAQIAEATGLHPETVRRKRRQGKLGEHRKGKHTPLTRKDLEKLGPRRGPTRVVSLVDHFKR